MPTRPPSLGWAPRAALIASLFAALLPLLADCGPARNQFAPPCPHPALLGDAADLDVFRSGTAPDGPHDPTDLVLHARIVGVNGTCREGDTKTQLDTAVNVLVELTRGPAMAGRETDVPVFLAVTERDTILDKHVYLVHATFPSNVDRITLGTGEIDLTLSVSPTKSGAVYTLLAGFQLTPDQMARGRRSQRP